MLYNLRLGRGESGGRSVEAQFERLDPCDPAEARDEMPAFDRDPIEVEIAKAGIGGVRRMSRRETGRCSRIVASLGPAELGQPGTRERIGMPGHILEEQGDSGVGEQVLGMLGEIREQQQRAGIAVAGGGDQRNKSPAAKAGAERRMVAAADQAPRLRAKLLPGCVIGHEERTWRCRIGALPPRN
jgi:hypothetical protein